MSLVELRLLLRCVLPLLLLLLWHGCVHWPGAGTPWDQAG
jgi:hypothetical protein